MGNYFQRLGLEIECPLWRDPLKNLEVFINAPAMEDGYIFQYFKGFKINYDYSAAEVYPLVCKLDQAIHSLYFIPVLW